MLKFTYPIGLGLTAIVGVPAALNSQSLEGSSEDALASALTAIDELLFISEALEQREAGSIQRLLDATEPASAPSAQQDEFIAQLRREVDQLQRVVDGQAGSWTVDVAGGPPTEGTGPATPAAAPTSPSPEDRPLELTGPALSPDRATLQRTGARQSLEQEGYNADAMRQGRLLFRGERYGDAIRALSTLADEPEAEYWIARSHEALGDEAEAMRRYNLLVADPRREDIAQRAAHDLSFLQWKQKFRATEGQEDK